MNAASSGVNARSCERRLLIGYSMRPCLGVWNEYWENNAVQLIKLLLYGLVVSATGAPQSNDVSVTREPWKVRGNSTAVKLDRVPFRRSMVLGKTGSAVGGRRSKEEMLVKE